MAPRPNPSLALLCSHGRPVCIFLSRLASVVIQNDASEIASTCRSPLRPARLFSLNVRWLDMLVVSRIRRPTGRRRISAVPLDCARLWC